MDEGERVGYEAGWNDCARRLAEWIAWSARANGQEQRQWIIKLIESIRAMRFKDSHE